MFIYKFCPECQKRNNKSDVHCVRCGDELSNEARFGKDVFAITLSAIILLSSATVFASRSYFNKKSDINNQPIAQVQNATPTQEKTSQSASSEVKQEPAKEKIKDESVVETPVNKETSTTPIAPFVTSSPVVVAPPVTTPTITAPAATVVVCDESKKTTLTNKYNSDISAAVQKRDQLISDASTAYAVAGDNAREGICKDIWDPNQRGICVSNAIAMAYETFQQAREYANNDYDSLEQYLTLMYGLDLKSAHCSS